MNKNQRQKRESWNCRGSNMRKKSNKEKTMQKNKSRNYVKSKN